MWPSGINCLCCNDPSVALDFIAATGSSGSGSRGVGPAGGLASSLFSPRQFSLGIAKVPALLALEVPATQWVARRGFLGSAVEICDRDKSAWCLSVEKFESRGARFESLGGRARYPARQERALQSLQIRGRPLRRASWSVCGCESRGTHGALECMRSRRAQGTHVGKRVARLLHAGQLQGVSRRQQITDCPPLPNRSTPEYPKSVNSFRVEDTTCRSTARQRAHPCFQFHAALASISRTAS
jgi:hypothetical protein